MSGRQVLNQGTRVVLDASGNGRLTIGPTRDPYWLVQSVSVRTNRPGQAPVPAFDFYLDHEDENGRRGTTYDGSRNESGGLNIEMTRGQSLIAVWTGGQTGDVATFTVAGYRGER